MTIYRDGLRPGPGSLTASGAAPESAETAGPERPCPGTAGAGHGNRGFVAMSRQPHPDLSRPRRAKLLQKAAISAPLTAPRCQSRRTRGAAAPLSGAGFKMKKLLRRREMGLGEGAGRSCLQGKSQPETARHPADPRVTARELSVLTLKLFLTSHGGDISH